MLLLEILAALRLGLLLLLLLGLLLLLLARLFFFALNRVVYFPAVNRYALRSRYAQTDLIALDTNDGMSRGA